MPTPPFLLATIMSAAAAILPAAQESSEAASLEIRFEGIEVATGQVMLALFDSESAYAQDEEPVRAAAVGVEGDQATARFTGLAPGSYAVKAFHDIDGDGRMATNPFGLPLEPFAFSNNAKPEGGPVRWEAARFAVEPGVNRISIAIR
jgi:uncharacterized protein (DUF2141 family)